MGLAVPNQAYLYTAHSWGIGGLRGYLYSAQVAGASLRGYLYSAQLAGAALRGYL